MHARRYLGAAGAIVLVTVAFQPGGAQPYSRQQLLDRGNNAWQTNCVVSAMNYYAILQQFPGWPNSTQAQRMRTRIESCRRGSVGMSGTDAKNDGAGGSPNAAPQPPIGASGVPAHPRVKACRAYAATALVQVQAQIDGQCQQSGPRWSTNYNVHYNWCMQSGTPQALQTENRERDGLLNQCVFKW